VKSYPSIPQNRGRTLREFAAHVFDKLDGSNLRFEWDRKRGWHKFGTRTQMLDRAHPALGAAIDVFERTLAEPLARLATDQRWQELVAFAEFWGPRSLGGRHEPDDPKSLTLFDLSPHKKGILGPEEFLRLCGALPTPRYLGEFAWTGAFVERVRRGELPGVTLEGVVGKAGAGHRLTMAKAKTQAWIDRILARYGDVEGAAIVDS
jgi:hypothetical protein